jgi:hypothetical protein
MLRSILPYLGYDVQKIPDGADIFFVFSNAPKSWLAFLFFGLLALLIILIYKINKSEHEVCPMPVKKFLGVLRCIVFIFIFFIFLDPALGVSIKKLVEPQILFMVDNSTSMSIKDNYISEESKNQIKPFDTKDELKTRIELLQLALKEYSLDQSLSSKGDIQMFSFDKNLNEKLTNQSLYEAVQHLKGDKSSTSITESVKEIIHLYNGKKIAGLILMTDGQSNTGAPLMELEQILKRESIPLFAIGLGNPEKAKNIKINDSWLPEKVFKDDPFTIQAKINGSKLKGDQVEVQLIEIPLNEKGEVIDKKFEVIQRKQLKFEEEEQEFNITFEHKSEKVGKFSYKVKIEPLAHESITSDNEKENQTEILSKSARVLLISGTATWDFRLLQTLLVRDKTINVSSWLQSMDIDMLQEGNTQIKKLPENEKELFEYDVVLMLDPNPIEFDEKWIILLQKFVEEKKGGLMFVAGPNYTSKTIGGFGTQKIKELLPVQFTDIQREHKDFMKVTFEMEWPIRLTVEGQTSYICSFNSNNLLNKDIWQKLPGIYWSYPAVEAKAGAKVLLEHTDQKLLYKEKNRPLLVTGNFGGGRTLYLGFNGIWRWRKNSEKYFDKFWIQSIRYLVEGKLESAVGLSTLNTNKESYISGESIHISAKIIDESGMQNALEKINGKIFKGSNLVGEFILRQEIHRKNYFEGEIKAEQTGNLILVLDDPNLANLKLERKFKVEHSIVEYETTEMNYVGLKSICDSTKGKFYYLSEIGKLEKDFPNLKETVIINLPPDSLWDTGRVFILLISLLTIEWVLRKKYKLL